MAIQITYFVHGTTTDNENGIASGWKDIELSELGKRQMLDLKRIVAGKKFDAIFCSDLKRAVTTAHGAFEGLTPIMSDERLRECNYGDYNGKPTSVVDPMLEQNITERFADGESCEDVKARIADFLDFLKQHYDGKHIAIVAHKAPQLAIEVLLRGKTWEQAFTDDWRKTKSWQPGWGYNL